MNAKQAKRARRDDAAKADAAKDANANADKAAKAKAKEMTAEELARVNAGWRNGGGAWRVGQPYIEDYSTGWVSGGRDNRRGG